MRAPIPGPKGIPGLGVAPQLLRDPYRPFLRWAAQYGDAYRPRLPGVTLTIVNHPDLVRQVLGAGGDRYAKGRMNHRLAPVLGDGIPISDGDKWKRNRRLMNPMFGRKQLDSLTATVADAVWERVEGWDRWCGTGDVVDLDPPFGSITMNVLLKAMFGTAVDADDVDRMVADFRDIGRYMAGLMLTVWAPDWTPVPWRRGGQDALERVNEFIARLIADRRAALGEHNDLLSLLLDARFDDGAVLSDVELRDELMGLLFGGFETTQSALGWTVALLDANPDAASSLFEELELVDGALPRTWDGMQALRWTKACFDEAQRLQGAPLFSREAVVPDEVGGIPVPAGSLVAVSPFALHRTPSLWKEPDRYDPGRFLDADVDRFAFIPFGAGPRHCIGSNLAYLEAVLTLAATYSRYRVRMQTGFTLKHDFHLSTGMKGGCPVTIHPPRTDRDMTAEPGYQESFEVHALDPTTGAGFVCATGRFSDHLVTWAAVSAGGGAFVEHSRDGDGDDAERVTFADGVLRIEEDGASVEVAVEDLHPETSWGAPIEDLAHGHVETSCRVSGILRVGEQEVRLDRALGHRDRSWGPRDLTACVNHRWLAGSCGPQLCFSLDNLVLANGLALSLGYVVRDGEVDLVRDLEVIVGLASDCLTPRLVEATAVCQSGRELVVRSTQKHQTFVDRRGWFVATDTLFEVEADGHAGIADLNLTVNPQQGREAPVVVQR